MNLTYLIVELRKKISNLGISAQKGLGKDLFEFLSSLTPIVNVDLLVYNDKSQFLLSRRNDPYSGCGWHVPGGCIRFRETIDGRLRKTALQELGLIEFKYNKDPIKVFEIFSNEKRDIANQDERAHFISIVYKCYVPFSYSLNNEGKQESDAGFLKWFYKLPEDFLDIQQCYKEILP